jgi:uncharacterized SAM-binding protein YcdF (DUF218 family)
MDAYAVIKQLLLPPGIILLLLALAFFLVRGTLGRMLLFVAWSMLLMMSLPGVAVPMIGSLERYPALNPEQLSAVDADAIVVLGATVYASSPEYGGHTVDSNSLQRTRYAAWLHRRTGLPVYVSGGAGEKAPGPAMARTLQEEFSVPVAGVDQDSQTTWENAMLTEPMLRADGIRRVLLVTQAWHMPRAVEAFQRAGVAVVPAPTGFVDRPVDRSGQTWRDQYKDWLPQAPAFQISYYAIHEWLGRVYYELKALLGQAERTA